MIDQKALEPNELAAVANAFDSLCHDMMGFISNWYVYIKSQDPKKASEYEAAANKLAWRWGDLRKRRHAAILAYQSALEVRAALQKGLEFAVLFLAFDGRDRGTDRMERTLDSLGKLALGTDATIRAVLQSAQEAKPAGSYATPPSTAALIAKAVEAEREACSKIADDLCDEAPHGSYDNGGTNDGWRMACAEFAAAIRSRKGGA